MAGNSMTFQTISDRGWRSGLRNLLRFEFARWWGTRRWWMQALLWTAVVGGLFYLSLTLMLGAFFSSRGPVLAIPLALIFLQQPLIGQDNQN